MTARRIPRLKPTLWDAGVVICVLFLAAAILFGRLRVGAAENLTAVVYADGAELDRVTLSDAVARRTYSANGYALNVEFRPDGVQVLTADCPTQDCVHTGTVKFGGQSIVCLPARIVIRLEGGAADSDAPDAVLR